MNRIKLLSIELFFGHIMNDDQQFTRLLITATDRLGFNTKIDVRRQFVECRDTTLFSDRIFTGASKSGLPLSPFKPTIKRKADYAFAIGPFVDLLICPEDLFILIEDGNSLVQFLDDPKGIREKLFFGSIVI